MNHDENPNDSPLSRELRDALSELATPERPPLAAITSRGRPYQRRRLAGFAGLGVTAAAAGAALTLLLTGALVATPDRSTAATPPTAPTRSTSTNTTTGTVVGPMQTAAFILTSNANGTDTLTLTTNQMLDPATLQQALTQHGIPALVKTGTYCTSNPAPPDPVSAGVLSIQLPRAPHRMVPAPRSPAPGEVQEMAAHTATVINPAAMPSGTELFFGYSSNIHAVFTDLIYTSSYTCSNSP
jgi:hypothetical protein